MVKGARCPRPLAGGEPLPSLASGLEKLRAVCGALVDEEACQEWLKHMPKSILVDSNSHWGSTL
eukprot:3668347-Karenia_brevis.AAC.1